MKAKSTWLNRAWTTLTPPSREAEFRASMMDRDRKVATVLVAVATFFLVASFFKDREVLLGYPSLTIVWGIRGVSIAISLVALFLVRRESDFRGFDQTVFLWSLLFLAGINASNALLPPDYLAHVAWDLLLTLGIYTVFPLTFARQTTLALLFSLAGIFVLIHFKEFHYPVARMDVIVAYLCANGVGILSSMELHRSRRRQFAGLQAEKRSRERLEAANAEIRTLRGIIPICAVCRNVQTDVGDWQMVEEYVRDHSDADFSHGVCPNCARDLYGDAGSQGEAPGHSKQDPRAPG